jgi:stage II sporulation protein AA (anti-sigma F factor antagonist)
MEEQKMNKNYEIKISSQNVLVKFSGDIDDSVCPIYKEEISNQIKVNKNKDFVFDFKNVTFIDSSGIGFILGRYNQLKGYKKKLYVSNTNPQIKKLFKISGIYSIVNELNEEKEGIAL